MNTVLSKKVKRMNDKLSFGLFIREKRKALEITLRGMARQLGIAPAYLSDIEKGKRYPPSMDKLMKIYKILKLTEDEKYKMFDLAGEGRNTIPPDIIEYIMSSQIVRAALRKAKGVATDDDWDEFIRKLSDKEHNA